MTPERLAEITLFFGHGHAPYNDTIRELVTALKEAQAELAERENLKEQTEKLRATLLHFTEAVIRMEERYRLPHAKVRQEAARECAEIAREHFYHGKFWDCASHTCEECIAREIEKRFHLDAPKPCPHGIPDGVGCLTCDTDGSAEAIGYGPPNQQYFCNKCGYVGTTSTHHDCNYSAAPLDAPKEPVK